MSIKMMSEMIARAIDDAHLSNSYPLVGLPDDDNDVVITFSNDSTTYVLVVGYVKNEAAADEMEKMYDHDEDEDGE